MHVACRDLDAAKELLQWGLACGFRESGVVLGNKKVMCAIRTSANGLEIPIARTATELLVSDEYLAWIVQVANEKFAANKRKTDQLLEAFKKTFGSAQADSVESVVTVALGQVHELASDAVKRTGHSSVVHDSNIVVFGGQGATPTGTTTRLAALQILSIADDNTLNVVFDDAENAAAPSARMQHSAVVIGDDMVVFGGRAGPTKPLNDVYTFNLRTKTWTHVGTVGEPPAPRYKHSSCVGAYSTAVSVCYIARSFDMNAHDCFWCFACSQLARRCLCLAAATPRLCSATSTRSTWRSQRQCGATSVRLVISVSYCQGQRCLACFLRLRANAVVLDCRVRLRRHAVCVPAL